MVYLPGDYLVWWEWRARGLDFLEWLEGRNVRVGGAGCMLRTGDHGAAVDRLLFWVHWEAPGGASGFGEHNT